MVLLLCPCVLHPSKGELSHLPLPFSSNPHFGAKQRQPALSCLESWDLFVTLTHWSSTCKGLSWPRETGEPFECRKTLQAKLYFKTKHLQAVGWRLTKRNLEGTWAYRVLLLSALHWYHETVQIYRHFWDVGFSFLCTGNVIQESLKIQNEHSFPGVMVFSLFAITILGCTLKCVRTPYFSMCSFSLPLWMISKFNFAFILPHPGLQQHLDLPA